MKKLLSLLLIVLLTMIFCLFPGMAMADAGDVFPAATDLLIDFAAEIVFALLLTLIGVLGAWLTAKIGKHTELENINIALQEVFRAAKTTVGELQQTIVDNLKAASKDGKLTQQEIAQLGDMLVDMTTQKLSKPTYDLLTSAAVDVNALITGAGESWINKLKTGPDDK